MAGHLPELFRTSAREIIGEYLPRMIGRPTADVLDDALWRAEVVDPAWQKLPLPCRLLGRQRIGWEPLFDELRKAAYETRGRTVQFRPDVSMRTAEIFKQAVQALAELMAQAVPASTAEPPAPASPPLDGPAHPAVLAAAPPVPAAIDLPGPAIGIDLGTTYSAVAYIDAHGRPVCIPNAVGSVVTPSVVLFEDGAAVVGEEAVRGAALEPHRVAFCVKRDMGASQFHRPINGERLPPEVISSVILRSLKADAERRLGPVSKAVITVPAYFDEPRRKATMDAGRMAGLQVLDIINEPTAAALAYGYQLGFLDPHSGGSSDRLRVFVYDLGGGTFDVTILEITGTDFKAVATDGDVRLGGRDWDEKLVELACADFQRRYGVDPRRDPGTEQELWIAAEIAKKTLTERGRASIYISHAGQRAKVEVTREEFEAATAALVNLTRRTSEIVLRQAGLSWNQIDRLLLVGGSTRMPMIVRMLEEMSGKQPDRSLAPDEAVAHGAALYADLLLRRQGHRGHSEAKFTLKNVNSHSLGIAGIDERTGRRVNHILIPKNTPLPHSARQIFHTARPNQTSVKVEVLEGESPRPESCTLVGVSTIRDLPPNLAAGWPITVSYHYEENGRLQVTAQVKGSENAATATFVRDNNLPESDLLAWSEFVAHESRGMSR